jgi:hypothetical protein
MTDQPRRVQDGAGETNDVRGDVGPEGQPTPPECEMDLNSTTSPDDLADSPYAFSTWSLIAARLARCFRWSRDPAKEAEPKKP